MGSHTGSTTPIRRHSSSAPDSFLRYCRGIATTVLSGPVALLKIVRDVHEVFGVVCIDKLTEQHVVLLTFKLMIIQDLDDQKVFVHLASLA